MQPVFRKEKKAFLLSAYIKSQCHSNFFGGGLEIMDSRVSCISGNPYIIHVAETDFEFQCWDFRHILV